MGMHHQIITPELRTTSRVVAEKFGKRHAHIIERVENTMQDAGGGFSQPNFRLAKYIDAQGKPREMYEMTRDGFTLVVMGMTGKAAMEWKIRFIEAFNAMEAELKAPKAASSAPTVTEFTDDMPDSAWLSLIRETRLAHGVAASQRVYAQSPFGQLLQGPESDQDYPTSPLSPEDAERLGFTMTFADAAILNALGKLGMRNPKTIPQLVHLVGYGPEETQECVDRLSAFDLIQKHQWQRKAWTLSPGGTDVYQYMKYRKKD